MAQSRREKIHNITRQEIKDTARQLMLEKGTAGLSIRAIARQLGLSAPALYRYFDSLDNLITALIKDAFTQLADTLENAAANESLATSLDRFSATAYALRQWALAHPVDFQLLYGNPIPGYTQPTGITYPPARRSFLVLAKIFAMAIESGEVTLSAEYCDFPSAIKQSLIELTNVEGHDLPLSALYLAATTWAKLHGHIMLELFNLIQPVIADVTAFYEYETRNFAQHIGFVQTERRD